MLNRRDGPNLQFKLSVLLSALICLVTVSYPSNINMTVLYRVYRPKYSI